MCYDKLCNYVIYLVNNDAHKPRVTFHVKFMAEGYVKFKARFACPVNYWIDEEYESVEEMFDW